MVFHFPVRIHCQNTLSEYIALQHMFNNTIVNVMSYVFFLLHRIYQQVEMLGLFLFNDSLVVTRRTTKHLPFERSFDTVYRFEACTSLTRLRVDDIPDTKCKLLKKSQCTYQNRPVPGHYQPDAGKSK